jgi:SOS regulatory protein LexA
MKRSIDLPRAVQRLRQFYREKRRSPSFTEIGKLFGYRSKNAAFELIDKLIGQGLVKKDRQGKLLLDSLSGIKLLGTVQAGWPSPAEEELVDTLSLEEYLVRHPEQSYLIKVSGDSMIDAGIHEGDLVIVERGRTARDKDIVIAQVDGEWTMKFYEKRGQEVRLIAANKKYPPILPKRELVIGGVVTAVIRKYK